MDQVDEQSEPTGGAPGPPGAVEELGQGEDRESSVRAGRLRSRWLGLAPGTRTAVTAVVAVALCAAVVLGFQHTQSGHARPGPTQVALPPIPGSALLEARDVCTGFDGSVLEVSFRLVNTGHAPVDLAAVRPNLPLGMLLTLNTVLTPSACAGGPPGPSDGVLNPGDSQPVTFRLVAMEPCPQAAPVAALVTLGDGSLPAVSVPVLVDLGSVQFADCATQSAGTP
jgi:hypothetical protein